MKFGIVIGLLASPASAQTFTPPQGCVAYLTVQKNDCEVDHHFTCETDPAGIQHRAAFAEDGMVYLGTIDAETQWVSSQHLRSGVLEQIAPNPADRASFSILVSAGTDTYDFKTVSDDIGTTRYVGSDTLTGKTRVIDGVTLDETAYDIAAYDAAGVLVWQSEGTEYISRVWRMFLAGSGRVTTPTDSFETNATPVQFISPGAPGFLSNNPQYGCGVMMSAAPVLQENSHDNL